MSIGPMGGILAGAAGSQLQQATGSDVERAKQATVDQKREDAVEQQADNAQGIAETDGKDHGTNDRDADGRRLWEPPLNDKPSPAVASAEEPPAAHGKDPTGECGNELDLTG